MMLPKSKRNSETLTGNIEPISFKDVVGRTQAIKFRTKTPNHLKTSGSNTKSTSKQMNRT